MYNCTLPSQTYRVWFWCNCIKQQHLSARSFYTLQEWYHPLTSVISLPVIQMDSYTCSTHIWKSWAHPSSRRETKIYFGFEKGCRFFHVTQSINLLFIILLFSTEERWGWRMGGNVFTVTMTRSVWFMLFIIFLSFLFPSVLCNKSVFLCLLTQFCVTGIDLPALGASSEFITILGHAQSIKCLLLWFSFLLSESTWKYYLICEAFPVFIPSIFVGLEPFSASPPGCDSTCQLGWQTFGEKK